MELITIIGVIKIETRKPETIGGSFGLAGLLFLQRNIKTIIAVQEFKQSMARVNKIFNMDLKGITGKSINYSFMDEFINLSNSASKVGENKNYKDILKPGKHNDALVAIMSIMEAVEKYGVLDNEKETESKTNGGRYLQRGRVRDQFCTPTRSILWKSRRGIVSNMGNANKIMSKAPYRLSGRRTPQQRFRQRITKRMANNIRRETRTRKIHVSIY